MPISSPYAPLLDLIPVVRHEVEIEGTLTRYWVYGPADAAVTVLLVHGYRGEHHGLEPVVAQLPDIRFIAPDLPGFGESAAFTASDHTVPAYAAWLRAFAAVVDPECRAVLLGHSFGSIIASSAVADGMSVPRLVLVNPIAVAALSGPNRIGAWITEAFYSTMGRLPVRLATALIRSPVIVRGVSLAMVKTRDPELRAWIHFQHDTYFSRFATRDSVVEGFRASVGTSVGDVAERITVPTLLVAADRDDITPVSAQYELQRGMPDATLTVIAGVGHLIHYEKPGEAAAAIEEFLGTASGRLGET